VFHLPRSRGGADVEVLGSASEEEIPDAAADQIRGVTVALQAPDDLQGVRVDVLDRNGVRRFSMRLLGIACGRNRRPALVFED